MTGLGVFLRTYLRRDRWMLPVWIVAVTLLYYTQAPSIDGLYATQAEFDRAAASMESNAAFVAMLGPPRELNTLGGQVAWQSHAFGIIVAGLMSMFLVGRHTRAEEESGRDELIRSGVVGRYAPLAATALLAVLANVVLGGVTALSLVSYDLPVAGSLSLGLGLTLGGLLVAAAALVAAQVTDGVRAMYGIVGTVLALAYGARAVGDVAESGLSWASPIGWAQAMRPYADEVWWPAGLLTAATIALVVLAVALFERRDIGSGLLPPRPGPARAGPGLLTATGLSWRLQRGAILGWTLGLVFMGFAYGTMGSDVEDMLGDGALSEQMFGDAETMDITAAFYGTAMVMIALLASGFAISSALRPLGEEDDGRIELLMATAQPRRRWLLGHVAMTVLGTLVVVLAGGLSVGLGFATVTGETSAIADYAAAVVPYLAPVLLLAACARLVHGVAPRLRSAAWLALAFCVVVLLFGELLGFPGWVIDLSPFSHLALTPAEEVRWMPVAVIAALAAGVSLLGQAAFARRDLRSA